MHEGKRIKVKSTCGVMAFTEGGMRLLAAANRTGTVRSIVMSCSVSIHRVDLDAREGDAAATAYLSPDEWEELSPADTCIPWGCQGGHDGYRHDFRGDLVQDWTTTQVVAQ